MVFKLTFEDGVVSCSSPSCVQRHLDLGWRLADPAQAEDLLEALGGDHAEPARAHFSTSSGRGPASAAPTVPEDVRR